MMMHKIMSCGALVVLSCLAACHTTPPSSLPSATDDGGQVVRSRDNSFNGRVYGVASEGSPLARLQIGMRAEEVQQIMGGPPDDVRSYPTGKVFIPFYYGSDGARIEWLYKGQGSVAFAAGRGKTDVVVVITHDAHISI